jgi:hypothetical protein
MDPYLEDLSLWPGVHQSVISLSSFALNSVLPSRYAASIGERLYVVQADRAVIPDAVVFETPLAGRGEATGGTGPVPVGDSPWVLTVDPVEVREVYVEILSLRDGERVVTVIEVLSHGNKAPGTEGKRLYVNKQRELLSSGVHLLEIDLLRGTAHAVAAPQAHCQRRGRWDYLVSLHRGGTGDRYEVWARTVRQRLPRVVVPLARDDPDVVLDLQAVLDRCYDEGAYARRVDYRRDPPLPLAGDDTAWAATLLKEKGLR